MDWETELAELMSLEGETTIEVMELVKKFWAREIDSRTVIEALNKMKLDAETNHERFSIKDGAA